MNEETAKETTPETPDAKTATDVTGELLGLERALTDFSRNFERSARRWEMMVYPAMLLFFILGISGFYLIYNLTNDMHDLASYVDPEMAHNLQTMSRNVESLSNNIHDMTTKIAEISADVDQITATMGDIDVTMATVSQKMNTLEPLLANISDMNMSMRAMTTTTGVMSRDMSHLNYNVGRPMSMFNMFPW